MLKRAVNHTLSALRQWRNKWSGLQRHQFRRSLVDNEPERPLLETPLSGGRFRLGPSNNAIVADPVRPNILGERVRRALWKTSIRKPSHFASQAQSISLVLHDEHRWRSEINLESPVSSGDTEGSESIGETSTTGTRHRVRMWTYFWYAIVAILTDIRLFILRIDGTLE